MPNIHGVEPVGIEPVTSSHRDAVHRHLGMQSTVRYILTLVRRILQSSNP